MSAEHIQLNPLISEFATQADADSYDVWFRAKVQEALDSKKPRIPHDKAMAEVRRLLGLKKSARTSRSTI